MDDLGKYAAEPPVHMWTSGAVDMWITVPAQSPCQAPGLSLTPPGDHPAPGGAGPGDPAPPGHAGGAEEVIAVRVGDEDGGHVLARRDHQGRQGPRLVLTAAAADSGATGEPLPICSRQSTWRRRALRADALLRAWRTTASGGDSSGSLVNIGRRAWSQGEGTSADGEPLSSAPVCGKESRRLDGAFGDRGRLRGGHGGDGRYGSRCVSNSCNAYGLARNRHVSTHQDEGRASGPNYRST